MEGPLNQALAAGYRHIDTAAAYGNEDVIGKVLQEQWLGPGKLRREDLFVVTKLWVGGVHPGGPAKWIRASLDKLRLDYVDMFLIHTVFNFTSFEPGNRTVADRVDHVAIWKVRPLVQRLAGRQARNVAALRAGLPQALTLIRLAPLPSFPFHPAVSI